MDRDEEDEIRRRPPDKFRLLPPPLLRAAQEPTVANVNTIALPIFKLL